MTDILSNWLRLWHIPGIGPRSFNFLLDKFNNQPGQIFACEYSNLVEYKIPERIARSITNHQSDNYLYDSKMVKC